MIPSGLSYRLSEESFINLPESIGNADSERLSTPSALLITSIIYFSASCNVEYASIVTFCPQAR